MTAIANNNLTALFDTLRTLAETNPAVLCKLRAIVETNTTADTTNDAELFLKAFDKADQGRIYVRICNMRKELGWSTERFDTMLRTLRANGTIQLKGGDPAHFTAEELGMCFKDEYNTMYYTMVWRR